MGNSTLESPRLCIEFAVISILVLSSKNGAEGNDSILRLSPFGTEVDVRQPKSIVGLLRSLIHHTLSASFLVGVENFEIPLSNPFLVSIAFLLARIIQTFSSTGTPLHACETSLRNYVLRHPYHIRFSQLLV